MLNRGEMMSVLHPKNKLNDLTGDKWIYLTQSVKKTQYPKSFGFSLRKKHGANKPPELMKELILFFTKKSSTVLDPFSGVGGTLIGAALCGRKALGIEINPEWINIYKQVCETEKIPLKEIIEGNCLEIMNELIATKRKFSLILTDPPYNINFNRTMCRGHYPNRNRQTDFKEFSNNVKDFSNCKTYEHYLDKIALFIEKSYELIFNEKYMIIITKNAYQNGKYILVNQDVAKIAETRGFRLKGEIIWHQNGVRLRPYGYPFCYVPNIIHHNILIFRKEK
jgi:DNA modification methylase